MSDQDAEIARLHAELASIGKLIKQMQREIEAERAARIRYDRIVAAARVAVAGPDSQSYTALADAIDAYDKLVRG